MIRMFTQRHLYYIYSFQNAHRSFQVYDQLQSLAKHNPWFVQSLQNIMSSCSLNQEAKAVAPGLWPAGSSSVAAPACRPPPPPPGADPAQAALILLLAVKVTSKASTPNQTAALLQDVVKQLEAGVGAAEILKRLAAHKDDSAPAAADAATTLQNAPLSCDESEGQGSVKNTDLSNIISSLVSSAQNMLTAVQQQQQQHQVPVSPPSCSEPTMSAGENKKRRDPQLMDMLYKSYQARMKNGIYNPDRNGRRQFQNHRSSPPKSSAQTPTTQVSGHGHHRPFCPKPIQGAKPAASLVSPTASASPTIPAASSTSCAQSYLAPMIQQQAPAAPPLMVPQQPAAVQTNAVLAQIQQHFAAAAAAASNPYAFHHQALSAAAAQQQQQQSPPAAYLTTNGLYQMPHPSAAMASNTFLSQQNSAAAQQLMWQQSAAAAAASQWQQHSLQTQSQVPPPPAQQEQQQQQQQQHEAISAAAAAAAAAAAQTNGYYGAAYLLAGSKRKYELEQQQPSNHEEAVKKLKLVHQPSTVNPGAMAAGTIADMAASAAMYATTYT